VVAGDTAPVREVVTHDETGRLVDFFDGERLVDVVGALLGDAGTRAALGEAARARMQAGYDLETICLPAQMHWVESIMQG